MKDFLGETGDELVNGGLASYIVIDNGGLKCFSTCFKYVTRIKQRIGL